MIHKNNLGSGHINSSTVSAYITFVHKEDAKASIQSLDGHFMEGHVLRASFGTTKYCNSFIRGLICNNPGACTFTSSGLRRTDSLRQRSSRTYQAIPCQVLINMGSGHGWPIRHRKATVSNPITCACLPCGHSRRTAAALLVPVVLPTRNTVLKDPTSQEVWAGGKRLALAANRVVSGEAYRRPATKTEIRLKIQNGGW